MFLRHPIEGQTPDERVAFDAAFLADPVAAYASLREAGPVHRAETPDGAPMWLVTRYADVRAALTDSRLSVDKRNSKTGYRGFSLPPELDANLLNMDGADHARVRRSMTYAFTPARIRSLRPRIQHIADDLLAAMGPPWPVDLIAAYAAPLPITVICELLGIAEDDRPDFRSWTDAMLAPDPAHPERARDGLASLHRFLLQLVSDKRARPGEDLLTTLVSQRDKEDQLSEEEIVSAAFLVLFAGYENVVNLFGNGLAALLANRDQLTLLRENPTIIPSAIDELLRFDPPPQLSIRRFAVEDIEIGGVRIPEGDTVMLSFASAHRDAERFEKPDTLELTRADNPHVGFGHGPHFCLGVSLARAELEIGLTALLSRFPNIELGCAPEELRRRRSFRNRGLLSLPIIG